MDERPKLTVEEGGLHRQQTLWIQGKGLSAILQAAEDFRERGHYDVLEDPQRPKGMLERFLERARKRIRR